jgi:hypothetical protein
MSDEKSFVPVILDREIHTPEADAFGHRHFAQLLQGLIESSRNEPPISIGLLGRWGSGKSSIKSLYLSSLADDASNVSNKTARSRRIHPITFNAWRFGGGDIKRALLRQVYLDIGGDKEKLEEALFKQVQKSIPVSINGLKRFLESCKDSAFSLTVAAVFIILIFSLTMLVGRLFDVTGVAMGIFGSAALASSAAFVKFILESTLVSKQGTVTRVEAPRTSIEQYEDFLLVQLQIFKKAEKLCERIVIFVDDLDRLSPEEMVGGLDAVRTFMEIPKKSLPDDLGIVFVISCDEDRIADALADKRKRSSSADLPGAVLTHADAHRFLDRIFQFRLEIPPFPKRDMRNFAEESLTKAFPDLQVELEKIGVSLQTLIDRMIHVGVSTPRNAIQVVNSFVQCWWVAKQRERDGAGTNSPGGLQEGSVTKHPLALAAISAIRVDFPDFYRELQKEPELIIRFTDAFLRGKPLDQLSDSVQQVLRRYCKSEIKVSDAPKVRTEYNDLRQYIASLQGLRWPKAMRPLLFLSQDPVSRKYGDKALAIYESFVSGDEVGVLSNLGRDIDAKQLSEADMRLLSEMVEELERETDVRRDNAASVLAALGDRYPIETAHLLLTPLARRLSESPELRWRIGVSKIGRILGPLLPNDRKELADQLTDDFLLTSGNIGFKLDTGESPSLDEAETMVKSACNLVLQIRRDDGLSDTTNQRLLTWLETRRIAIEGKEITLPFDVMEDWMDLHENWLLPAMKERYTALVVQHLQESEDESLNGDAVSQRCQRVIDTLLESGEESRALLWGQLSEFVEVNQPLFVTLAVRNVRSNIAQLDASAASLFISSFATRLSKELVSSSDDGFDLSLCKLAMVEIVSKRANDFTESCMQPLMQLVLNLSLTKENAVEGAALLTALGNQFEQLTKDVVSSWTGRFMVDLPEPCIEWLAVNTESHLSGQQRRQVVSRLSPVSQTDNVTEEQGRQFDFYIRHLSEPAFATAEIKNFIEQIISFITPRHANPNNYLRRVFPPIPLVLMHASPSVVGAMLQQLFTNAKGDPDVFGWLHSCMADYWPEPTPELAPYSPEVVYSDARGILTSNPTRPEMSGPLRSLTQLVLKGLISKEYSKEIADLACKMWRRHRAQATETLSKLGVAPSAIAISEMCDGFDPKDDDSTASLKNTWSGIGLKLNYSERVDTARQLLSRSPISSADTPDSLLHLWVKSKSDEAAKLLEDLLVNDGLNDEQRRRVLLEIERQDLLSADFGERVIPALSGRNDCPQAFSLLMEFEVKITPTHKDKKYALGQKLVESFRLTSSVESKNQLAAWLQRLETEGVLSEFGQYGEVSEEELSILDSHFGKSSKWRKAKQSLTAR